jgi:2'-hydroxyisoflavone reductase
MPTWIPRNDPDYAGANASNVRARSAGLTFRPLGVTAVDSLAWFNAQPPNARERMLKSAGLLPERERDVLAAWHAH